MTMITNKPHTLRVNYPCPMTLGRLKNDSGFYCTSCDKIIVDFRDKTVEEIVKVISGKTVCGIFNNEQIVSPDFSFKRGLLFKVLTVLAFLGFNVRPMQPQTKTAMVKDSSSLHQNNSHAGNKSETKNQINDTTQEPIKVEKRKWWQKTKKSKYRTIGCPSF